MMYWSDVANEVIMQSKLDGTDVRTIVNTGLIEPGIRNGLSDNLSNCLVNSEHIIKRFTLHNQP